MIRMITSDMDGTLLAGSDWANRRLPHDFAETLDELDRRGIHFLAASGRAYPSVRSNFGGLADRVDYICDNGGCLVCGGQVVHVAEVPKPDAYAFLDLCRSLPVEPPFLTSPRGMFMTVEEHWPGSERERPWTFIVPDLRQVEEPLTKLTVRTRPGADLHALRETLQAAMGNRLTFLISGPTMIDVMAHGVDKGSGIRFFRDYWGIAKEECMSFGDQYNDLGQFAESGYSFAMGNAAPEIKAAARFVAGTNENDGVTRAIWQYALND